MASSGVDVLAKSVHATTAHLAAAETDHASISRLRQHSRVPALRHQGFCRGVGVRLPLPAGQKELRAIVLMLIAMAATLIIAPLSYRFIESPILRLKKTFSPGRNMAVPS